LKIDGVESRGLKEVGQGDDGARGSFIKTRKRVTPLTCALNFKVTEKERERESLRSTENRVSHSVYRSNKIVITIRLLHTYE